MLCFIVSRYVIVNKELILTDIIASVYWLDTGDVKGGMYSPKD